MQQATVNGTLLADGTLQLNQPLRLPPGPVEVSVRSRITSGRSTLAVLEDIWAESQREGFQARTAEEIDAEIESIRQAAADEIGEFAPGPPNRPGQVG